MNAFTALLRRDLELAWTQGGGAAFALVFFAITVTLFPLGVGPEANVLARIAPGVLWVAALLAAMISLDRLFAADMEDGSFDILALLPVPLSLIVAAKCLAHWIATALPLIAAAPLLALMINLEAEAIPVLVLALLIGTPAVTAIGAVGAALTVGIRRAGMLVALIVLPLTVPVLIFGVTAVDAARAGLDPSPHLMLLGGMTCFAIVLGVAAAAAALKFGME